MTTSRAVLISSKDLALMEAERKRLRKERDAATNALHGMRRRVDRLTAQLRELKQNNHNIIHRKRTGLRLTLREMVIWDYNRVVPGHEADTTDNRW